MQTIAKPATDVHRGGSGFKVQGLEFDRHFSASLATRFRRLKTDSPRMIFSRDTFGTYVDFRRRALRR
jgi:hypothetical protein